MARKAQAAHRKNRRLNTSWVRHKILLPPSGPLRVLTYARFSNDERQDRRSIPAQNEFCSHFLESLDVTNAEITCLKDEGISGEQSWRPGINQVREGIERKAWDLILVEDSSRLFRDPAFCIELVRSAVQQGIRVICINDYVDTAEEDRWEEQLYEAQRHHALTNKFTIHRIRRSQDERWNDGAAMGPWRSGYRRVPSFPASVGEPAKGPFYDEIDEQWLPIVYEAFERIAAGQPVWAVGNFLRERKLPGVNGDPGCSWTDKEVIALIQCWWYRGLEKFRETVSKKQPGGKRKQIRNKPELIEVREMPNLRMVPDWLWYKANDAVSGRTRRKDIPRGADHPLTSIPRDSRGPLSGVFFCARCKEKMHQTGRNEGGYQCRNAKKGPCWNKATALRAEVHRRLSDEICGWLRELDGEFPRIIETLQQHLGQDANRRRQELREQLERRERLEATCEALVDSIENMKQTREPPERLGARLIEREQELAETNANIERLDELAKSLRLPTVEELKTGRDQLVKRLLEMNREAGAELRQLVGKIWAVPYQQFSTNKVVLRAAFDLDLRALLPNSLWLQLGADRPDSIAAMFPKISMLVNLFEPSTGPKYGLRALALQDSGLSLREVGMKLGFSERELNWRTDDAVRYGKLLRAAGLTDAYIELEQAPTSASRWRTHERFRIQSADNKSDAAA